MRLNRKSAISGIVIVGVITVFGVFSLSNDFMVGPVPENIVTRIIDGDTIHVDGKSIRFALASAPELSEAGGAEARSFIVTLCPVGSEAIVDEDSGQPKGSHGRVLAVIYCNGMNLNSELLDSGLGYLSSSFCDISEFGNEAWAQKHGC